MKRDSEGGFIVVSYEGQKLIFTNYWSSPYAARGFCYLSANAGAFGLFLPKGQEQLLAEMKSGRFCAITKGFASEYGRNMFELLFDDDTKTPYQISLCEDQIAREWCAADIGSEFRLDIYTAPTVSGEPVVAHSMPCGVRNALYLPYLKPWRGKKEQYG